jgi:hypothetical protein
MSDVAESSPVVDPNLIGCKIVDVHGVLQQSFDDFATSGENTLEDLARRIQTGLAEMPAFLINNT